MMLLKSRIWTSERGVVVSSTIEKILIHPSVSSAETDLASYKRKKISNWFTCDQEVSQRLINSIVENFEYTTIF
jgi:hypothetical protein